MFIVPKSTVTDNIKITRLETKAQWFDWIAALQTYASTLGIWHLVDPDKEAQADDRLDEPTITDYEEYAAMKKAETPEEGDNALSNSDIQFMYSALAKKEARLEHKYELRLTKEQAIKGWVASTLTTPRHEAIITALELKTPNAWSLRDLIKAVKKDFCPSTEQIDLELRLAYRIKLKEASSPGVNPEKWVETWRPLYERCRARNMPELLGTIGSHDFLQAVEARMAPDWAQRELQTLFSRNRAGETVPEATEYALDFLTAVSLQKKRIKRGGIYATLGDRSDNAPSGQEGYTCPCRADNKEYSTHKWKPEDCYMLKYALTGKKDSVLRSTPKPQRCDFIRKELNKPQWKDLKAALSTKYKQSGPSAQASLNSLPETNVCGTVIDPRTVYEVRRTMGIFAALEEHRHPFSTSTIWDTGGAMHLVNSVDLLEKGSFVPCTGGIVESGNTSFQIIGYGKRVLKGALKGAKHNATVDLILLDVAVVEGWHVNIISSTRLRKSGLWLCGFDNTLRFGEVEHSSVAKQLETHSNLLFFEYTPLFSYSPGTQLKLHGAIPISLDGILMSVITKGAHRPYRPSQDPARVKDASAHTWHLRSGHLAQEALEKLVSNARNVKINGLKRIDCEVCSVTHAAQVISRRESEHKSPRPFWRVCWDLQDYTTGFDGSNWLLVIKDEFSGWVYARPLPTKSLTDVFDALFCFERWVRRQYSLYICVIRQDNERAVIAIKGVTIFQRWARTEGITLELAPPDTHESNGGIERANKSVTTTSIAMLTGAGLPTELWPESTRASAYLLNISPSRRLGWKSPIEVLEQWFKNNAPLPIRRPEADLRPNWGALRAYGCRAYSLKRAREQGRNKRKMKTEPRGDIGYLVGYVASNLFRIWIPCLERVVTTRNVDFNENVFYEPRVESAKEHLIIELNDWVIQNDLGFAHEIDMTEDIPQGQPEGLNSGVEAPTSTGKAIQSSPKQAQVDVPQPSTQEPTGLQTPRETPQPEPAHVTDMSDALSSIEVSLESPDVTTPEAARLQGNITPLDLTQAEDTRAQSSSQQSEHTRDTSTSPQETTTTSPSSPSPRPPRGRGRGRPRGRGRGRAGRSLPAAPTRQSARQQAMAQAGSRPRWDSKSHERIDEHEGNYFVGLFEPDQLGDEAKYPTRVLTTLSTFVGAVTKSRNARKQPDQQVIDITNLTKLHRDSLPTEPDNWREMQHHPLKPLFEKAAQKEVNTLREKGTWKEIEQSKARSKPLPLRWVFKYKFNEQGFLDRCKARLCVRGDLQELSALETTYAATLASRSFRVMIAIAAQFDLEIKQFDVVNAFVNAQRSEHSSPVTCYMPDGFKHSGRVIELQRALYGLRDSPALWFKDFSSTLQSLGMTPSKEEPCLFFTEKRDAFVIFFVDDILVFYHRDTSSAAQMIIAGIKRAYELQDQGDANWFLGIKITRNREEHTIHLSHESYIKKVAARFGLDELNTRPAIPIPTGEFARRPDTATAQEIKIYQEKIGSLLYTAVMIRADVAFSASTLSRFLTNPSLEHQQAADQAIRYLYVNLLYAIRYGGRTATQPLLIASDASFADDLLTRKSSQGYLILLFGGLVQWKATRQDTVTTSTTEAELLSLEQTAKETMSLKRLFSEMRFKPGSAYNINCDNLQTIRLVIDESMRITTRLRHVDIQGMWLKQEFEKGTFEVSYLPTAQMPADGLTKALPRQRFEHFRALLNMVTVAEEGSEGTA